MTRQQQPDDEAKKMLADFMAQGARQGLPVEAVTELYYRGRFGEIPLTKEELELAYQSLQHVKLVEPPNLQFTTSTSPNSMIRRSARS